MHTLVHGDSRSNYTETLTFALTIDIGQAMRGLRTYDYKGMIMTKATQRHNQLYSHCTLRVKLADPTPAAFELVTWYTPESSLTVSMMMISLADTVTLLSLMAWLFLVHMKLSGGGLAANSKVYSKCAPSKMVVGLADGVYSGGSALVHVCMYV